MEKQNAPTSDQGQVGSNSSIIAIMRLATDANRSDWERLLNKVMRELGFTRYLVSLGPNVPAGADPLAGIITTFPQQWLEEYRGDRLIEIDPILRHCRRDLVPLFWEKARRRARGRSRQFWQQRERYGLRSGLSVPLRYESQSGTLSVAFEDSPTTEHENFLSPAVFRLFMLIPYLLTGMRYQRQRPAQPRHDLTPREMECLYWASVGKTTWEISQILTCSERTIDFHLLNATRKLGSVNRQQAVSAASARGLFLTAGALPINE
ncbi:helix-turn-helix transcriptional regulator [Pseudomonas graminis]|uniref:helix-turn-helix transcriptional regulator n=1 Tax=Pseudomonas graminis TaxID=158627 RepID=UPI003B67FEF9